MPYATCFICSQNGHISKACPKNAKGIYPNGGCCKICQSTFHLIKDCPEKNASKALGGEITLSKVEDFKKHDTENDDHYSRDHSHINNANQSLKKKVVVF